MKFKSSCQKLLLSKYHCLRTLTAKKLSRLIALHRTCRFHAPRRLAYYETLKMLTHKTIRRFTVLSGVRRVGKTTIMYQIIDHLIDGGINPKNIFYATFDNPILKLVDVDSVLSIYESLYPIEGTRYIFFDEIQYSKNWELWMKVIYDSRKDIRLVATGSASPILEKGATDSGTGRWSVLKIPTMSFF